MSRRQWLVRLARALLTFWCVVTLTFVVLRQSGDPAVAMLSPDARADEIAQFRKTWHLDDPLGTQYLSYLSHLAQGDFGMSYQDGRPAWASVREKLPNSVTLAGASYLIAILVGIPAGIVAAVNRNGWIDRAVMSLSVFGFAMPSFFLGVLLILLFSFTLRWLPSSGVGGWQHLLMPAATLGLYIAGTLARFTRSAMLEVLGRPYVRTARAKGASPLRCIFVHALPNAAIPIVTVIGLNVGAIVGGAVVVETVFGWPGIGRLLVAAVSARDLSLVQLLVLMLACIMVGANLLVDLLYAVLDPRVRVQR
ncbi:ABC transporter permease [Paracidovorax avenae]|uniref:ABC transporter permease n=1 Tax=Paracidovorax avenae TaxID=80867 RepID=UPI000D20B211|nr:ABC transporter permease [Paracidovorax avenae]AVS67341.1 ABC transporter permease [Paracidovorax avenae]